MLQEGRAAVEVHAEALVKPIVAVGSATTMRVELSAAAPPAAARTDAAAPAVGPDAAARHLWVTVEPRGLKLALGVRRTRALRLSPHGSAAVTFRLVGVDPGPGEVTVVICGEGREPLAALRATIEVVGSGDHDQTGLARVTAVVPARPAGQPPVCPPPSEIAAAEPEGEVTAAGSGSTA
ncbi:MULTISPECIES: DUF7363 domain-containing protein [unclassified Agromyces]|uniref:DUF7363 domain-containing protein n=1 Tax=unclassified Agromyces TaxID=2639701 RepID=UPI00301585CF